MRNKKLVDKAEKIMNTAEEKVNDIFRKEIVTVFAWFKKKFPKRHLEWNSGNGDSYWEIDGERLFVYSGIGGYCFADEWKNLEQRHLHCLQPLADFQESIDSAGQFIAAGCKCLDIGRYRTGKNGVICERIS